jgi:hypothetical protein
LYDIKNDADVINQTKRIWLTDEEYVDSHGIDKLKEKKIGCERSGSTEANL